MTQIAEHRSDILPHFNLFGDGPRFLQVKKMGDSKAYPASQMVFHYSTGNSPTLLDHAGGAPRKLEPAFLARATIAYQNFFVGGSMASKVKGNGPSLKILHTFLIGSNLKQTVLSNLLDQETIQRHYSELGIPYWEQASSVNADNKTLTSYLGRLVPISCALHIEKDGEEVQIDQGNQHPEWRESPCRTREHITQHMSTYTLTKIEIDHETAFNAGLRDSYEWHRKVWQAFPDMDGQARDFLTRLDELDGRLRLLLLSPSQPTRPDWCPQSAWESKQSN